MCHLSHLVDDIKCSHPFSYFPNTACHHGGCPGRGPGATAAAFTRGGFGSRSPLSVRPLPPLARRPPPLPLTPRASHPSPSPRASSAKAHTEGPLCGWVCRCCEGFRMGCRVPGKAVESPWRGGESACPFTVHRQGTWRRCSGTGPATREAASSACASARTMGTRATRSVPRRAVPCRLPAGPRARRPLRSLARVVSGFCCPWQIQVLLIMGF